MTQRPDRPRVLLLWPGGLFDGGANFGVPQLLSIAGVLEGQGDAIVDVVDLDLERAFGHIDLRALCRGYDLVGVSCYSSYDYLKVMAIAEVIRAELPRAWLVTGGYHPSARPNDFTRPGSPFDFVVVGDGEGPLLRLVRAMSQGRRPLMRVLRPESLADPNVLAEYDWDKLSRYRPVARRVASQAEIYLSRGCPYDCAFCMERAKRDVSWRAFEPLRAVEEMHRLDRFLDLSDWTLFVADALFGMKRAWRKEFLEELARRPIRAKKIWLLIRVDLVDREDIELMARANVSPGFGLESGDPEHLKRIRKTGKLAGYLDHMVDVAEWARELDVPFGANVILGHPGETEASLRTTARYLRKLFLDPPGGTTGFLSVDPFRLYPGSPIDEERADWERDTGMHVHRYPWWEDGDQTFLAEWVDASRELDFRTTLRLKRELFDPILLELPSRFAYTGPARDFYMRAIEEQVELASSPRYLYTLGMWHLWRGLVAPEESRRFGVADDAELAEMARAERRRVIESGISGTPELLRALEVVPRERFVSPEHIALSVDDVALPLEEGATVSAMHAYAAALGALSLKPGDHLVELGGGSGYGAAVASEVVGAEGSVLSIEIRASLADRARANLADTYPQVEVVRADAHQTDLWRGATSVYVAFAVERVPDAWIEALGEGGFMVVPVGRASQQLMLFEKIGGRMTASDLGPVRYVRDAHPG